MMLPAKQLNIQKYAPVVLFTYKRLPILKRVVNSLLANKECSLTPLIVYSDGPKNEEDETSVKDVRDYLKKIKGFKSIEFIFQKKNLGLAQSFIRGITETLQKYEQAIFLEDDNLLSKNFLSFMNKALNFYKDNEKVICVSGYSFPIKPIHKQPYFLRGAETWSMGTWRRGWKFFCEDGNELFSKIKNLGLLEKFSSDGFNFHIMLQRQIRGEIDSWGVRWWASAFVNNKYCLYPNKPLCVSIGYGSDSVHNKNYSPLSRQPTDLIDNPINNLPETVEEDIHVNSAIRRMNKSFANPSVWRRLVNKIGICLKSNNL